MISGYSLVCIIVVLFILVSALFVFCSCCGDNSNKLTGSEFKILKSDGNEEPERPAFKRQCSCTTSFKGLCDVCKRPEFVNDGELGKLPDFSNYGGHLGLDGLGIGATAKVDPTRGFSGKNTNPWEGPKKGTIKQDHFV